MLSGESISRAKDREKGPPEEPDEREVSEDLFDLNRLINAVTESFNLVVLLTPNVMSRPWCLLEMVPGPVL